MARALNQILTELDSIYNPQKDLYRTQLTQLDPLMEAENKGLEAAKTDAFKSIETGANRKGLYYSGMPIQEQAQYTGSQFLPSVANLRAKYAQQKFNIQDAIAKITQDQYLKGQSIYQSEMDRDAAAAAARSGGGGAGVPSFGFGSGLGGGGGGSDVQGVSVNPADQELYNKMFIKPGGGTWSDRDLVNDYNRTLRYARMGNVRDQQKLRLYHAVRSDIFGSNIPTMTAKSPSTIPGSAFKAPVKSPVPYVPGKQPVNNLLLNQLPR